MLGKLLKYDLKAGERIFGAMYFFIMLCAVIARTLSILGGINSMDSNWSVFFIFYDCSFFIMIICIVASCAITLVWIVLRYRNNLLRDEGYLMHTLPVTPLNLYFSKMISSIVWFLADIVVIFIAFIVSGFPKIMGIRWENIVNLSISLGDSVYHINGIIFLTLLIVFWIIALYAMLAQAFASINIGYTLPFGKGNSRDLMSIAIYIITYIIMQIIGLVVVIISALLSIGKLDFELMSTNEALQNEEWRYIYILFGAATLFFIVFSVIYSTVSIRIMQKKLDLE